MLETINGQVAWDPASATAGFWAILTSSLVVSYIINAWLLGRIFKKAGVGRWKAWIPLVNEFAFLKIGGRSGGNIFFGIAGYILALISFTSLGIFNNVDSSLTYAPVMCIITSVLAVAFLVIYIYKFISAIWNVQKKLGKSGPFIILHFINVVAPLWYWILALDGSKYNNKVGRPQIK